MSVPYWKTAEPDNTSVAHLPAQPVNEQHGLPVQFFLKPEGSSEYAPVTLGNPIPVLPQGPSIFSDKVALSADVAWRLALEGYVYIAADGDQNDRVTGQTSFANTTPTFLLHNPNDSARLCIPFFYQLAQTGIVAGGDISVDTELVYPSAYATDGTAERIRNARIGKAGAPVNKCLLYSGATATAGYGISVGHVTLAADVSGAEGIINIYEWQCPSGVMLDPNTSLNVFSSSSTPGPTWGWHFVWAEVPFEMLA